MVIRISMNTSSIITCSRILLIPFIIFFFYYNKYGFLISGILFSIGAITDFIDGYLARKWKQVTKLGAFLDPLADKLITTTMLILMIQNIQSNWIVVPTIFLILRDMFISSLRAFFIMHNKTINVSIFGKIKTLFQIMTINFMFSALQLHSLRNMNELLYNLDEIFYSLLYSVGVFSLYCSLFFSCLSLVIYFRGVQFR